MCVFLWFLLATTVTWMTVIDYTHQHILTNKVIVKSSDTTGEQ